MASIVVYFLPSIIALLRGVPHKGSVVVVNLFLGWTVIGWIVAMAMAARSHYEPAVLIRSAPSTDRDAGLVA